MTYLLKEMAFKFAIILRRLRPRKQNGGLAQTARGLHSSLLTMRKQKIKCKSH